MVSSITPKKGQIHAIKAIHALKARGVTARLLLGGDAKPSYLEILEQLVEDLEISHLVQFEGFVADPDDIYFRADCLLVCSDHEALSRAALEATSTAMPVIARNSGGNPEIVTHQVTGLLFDSFDELVESMYEMAITPEKGKKYGLAGWKLARNRFNVEDYAESVHRIIRAVIAEFAVQVSNPSQISHEEII
jgi:glycosyltransferase involved in cell wall biosynthesis